YPRVNVYFAVISNGTFLPDFYHVLAFMFLTSGSCMTYPGHLYRCDVTLSKRRQAGGYVNSPALRYRSPRSHTMATRHAFSRDSLSSSAAATAPPDETPQNTPSFRARSRMVCSAFNCEIFIIELILESSKI